MGQGVDHYFIFETTGGFCGIAWSAVGIITRGTVRTLSLYGYARVSTLDQDLSIQHSALKGRGAR